VSSSKNIRKFAIAKEQNIFCPTSESWQSFVVSVKMLSGYLGDTVVTDGTFHLATHVAIKAWLIKVCQ